MKTFSTVLAALTLTFSGSAMADRDDWRAHRGDRHYGHHKDFRGHHHNYNRQYRGYGHHGPRVSHHYYGAPAYYVAPPPRYYGYDSYGHRGGGVTIVLPPIRFGH